MVEADIDQAVAAASAQTKAGNVQWDALSSIDAPYMPRLVKEGAIEKIDASAIPGLSSLPKAAVHEYGIGVLNSVVTVSYRSGDNITPLKSVKDFFDPNIKGARAISSNAGEAQFVCALALMSDGVSVDDLSKGIDFKRCLTIVDRERDERPTFPLLTEAAR
ncbi:spermidine/putrescine-binding protein [Sinorhizobium terangae]|uniref:Extracellular solute-binding protein n=1 Tax=Sinorhizobium terangae TaxID=110322 RepID=A0A6N7LF51_SINTE|nr:spermidine/putrescine-binding protein [Sinorhizobium terangae]MQX16511.1 hypothetical protein [Sinorhizobium terangae]